MISITWPRYRCLHRNFSPPSPRSALILVLRGPPTSGPRIPHHWPIVSGDRVHPSLQDWRCQSVHPHSSHSFTLTIFYFPPSPVPSPDNSTRRSQDSPTVTHPLRLELHGPTVPPPERPDKCQVVLSTYRDKEPATRDVAKLCDTTLAAATLSLSFAPLSRRYHRGIHPIFVTLPRLYSSPPTFCIFPPLATHVVCIPPICCFLGSISPFSQERGYPRVCRDSWYVK